MALATAELLKLCELGAFTAEDRFELIGGEIVPMSPESRRHRLVAEELELYWQRRSDTDIVVTKESQLDLSDDTYTKPDLWVRPAAIKGPDVRGPTVLLVVEVAQSSLSFDLGPIASQYAAYGVREYWVIDAQTLAATVNRQPGKSGYMDVRTLAATDELIPHLAPVLAVRLADLDI